MVTNVILPQAVSMSDGAWVELWEPVVAGLPEKALIKVPALFRPLEIIDLAQLKKE